VPAEPEKKLEVEELPKPEKPAEAEILPEVEKPDEAEAPPEPEMPPKAEEPVVPKEPAKVEKPPKPEKPEAAPSASPAKKKKINKMTLSEIETKLEEVKGKMGGFDSKYAQQLILRKDYLNSLK